MDHLAKRLHAHGKIKDLCADAGFYQRLILIEKQFPNASVLMHKYGILPKAFQQYVPQCGSLQALLYCASRLTCLCVCVTLTIKNRFECCLRGCECDVMVFW